MHGPPDAECQRMHWPLPTRACYPDRDAAAGGGWLQADAQNYLWQRGLGGLHGTVMSAPAGKILCHSALNVDECRQCHWVRV